MPRASRIPTLTAIAAEYGVSETTVHKTKRRFDDFPIPNKQGYLRRDIEAFCRRHSLWHHRAATVGREDMLQARIDNLLERTENERIRKERQQIEHAKELGQILDFDETVRWHSQLAATIVTALDAIEEPVERALPPNMSHEDKERVLSVLRRGVAAVRTAAQDFVKGPRSGEE